MKTTLAVRNERQKVLFEKELMGQLSDGQWENATPHGHWRVWCHDIEVVVDPENLGRDFHADKDNYNFIDGNFLKVVGERMISTLTEAGLVQGGYGLKHLRRDLADLKTIVRKRRLPKANARMATYNEGAHAITPVLTDQQIACLHDDLDVLRQRAWHVQRDLAAIAGIDGTVDEDPELIALLEAAKRMSAEVEEVLA